MDFKCLRRSKTQAGRVDSWKSSVERCGNVRAMTNQQLMDDGHQMMDETDQAIERSKKVVTDRCIIALLFLIIVGVIAIIIVKLVHPDNKDIRDIPGSGPSIVNRRLLLIPR